MARTTLISLALFLMLAAAPGAATEIDPISLEQAIDIALKQNRNLKLREMSVASRLLGVEQAESRFALQIKPQGEVLSGDARESLTYGLSIAKASEWGTQLSVEGLNTRESLEHLDDVYRSTVRFDVRQPLLRKLGPLVNREPVARAESQAMAARRELELARTDLVVQVVETYEEMFRLQRQMEFDEQTLRRLDRLLRVTKVREKQGRASRVDALRVELQRGEAQVRLNRTQERLAVVRGDFADLLGMSPEIEFAAVPGPILAVDPPQAEAAEEVALANRLDYAQVQQDYRDALRGVRIARRNLLPDLDLLGRYQRLGEGTDRSESFSLSDDSWFVGLSVSSDLNRRREKIELAQTRLDKRSVEQTAEIVRFGVKRQVRQALLVYERTRNEILFAQRNYNLAQNRAILARRLFEIGRGDSFAATDAEDALLQARNQMLAAQAEASIAAYRLLRSMGTLIEYPEELKAREQTAPGS